MRVCLLQAYILFRAELAAPFTFSAGTESLEVALFEPDNIPFDEVRVFVSMSVARSSCQVSFPAQTSIWSYPVDAT